MTIVCLTAWSSLVIKVVRAWVRLRRAGDRRIIARREGLDDTEWASGRRSFSRAPCAPKNAEAVLGRADHFLEAFLGQFVTVSE